MIQIGPEPTGLVVRRADILTWLPGLTRDRWKKIHHTFRRIYVPGGDKPAYVGQQPHYSKSEIKTKLVDPLLEKSKS